MYSQKTQELLNRCNRIGVMDYRWDEKKILALTKKIYKKIKREYPKKINIYKNFMQASQASQAWQACVDYWEPEYVLCFEYSQKNKINEHDKFFLELQELMLQAKEVGLGMMFENDKNEICLVPCCQFKLDDKNRYHSLTEYAAGWPEGEKKYYIDGVYFEKDLWEKISKQTISAVEAVKIKNQEQKIVALKYLGWDKVIKELKAEEIDKKILKMDGQKLLHKVLDINKDGWRARFLQYTCPSDGKQGLLRVDHSDDKTKTVDGAREYGFRRMLEVLQADGIKFGIET